MKKTLLLYICCLPLLLFPQNSTQYEVGLPLVRNYSPKEYNAFSQNWGFAQDSRGVLYFANGDGLLEYDGSHWRIIKITNNYTVFSIAIDKENIIYVGSTSEFGYINSNKKGKLKFVSLLNKFAPQDRKFNYIRSLYATEAGIF
ncbi:MAG: hypothetical protein HGB12_01150, partial [Bacteroidetes bacterium]|nr:hypothetical protein [Bacteroidota bacterium]